MSPKSTTLEPVGLETSPENDCSSVTGLRKGCLLEVDPMPIQHSDPNFLGYGSRELGLRRRREVGESFETLVTWVAPGDVLMLVNYDIVEKIYIPEWGDNRTFAVLKLLWKEYIWEFSYNTKFRWVKFFKKVSV